jgi:putative CocE/NonD family hydrolase
MPIGRACAIALAISCSAPLAAQPYPDVLSQSRYVAVRDGTRLAISIYRPAAGAVAADARLPVVFAFTPYRARYRDPDGKVTEAALGDNLGLRSLLRAGYVVAVADVRGKGASFGHRRGFQDRTEAQDGYDLVEWLADQPFSDGKVGMVGCSYLGGSAFQVATTAPPSLKAAFIGASDLDKYAFVRNGGITAQFNTRPDEEPAVDLATVPMDEDRDGSMLRAAVAEHSANTPMGPLWYGMPYRDSVSSFTGTRFWEEVGPYTYLDKVRSAGIATYFWGNWRDEPTSQIILSAANLGSRVLAGPGGHCAPPPGFDLAGEIVAFFDHYLKGKSAAYGSLPRATYWVEGLNGTGAYVTADQLPGVESRPGPVVPRAGSDWRPLGWPDVGQLGGRGGLVVHGRLRTSACRLLRVLAAAHGCARRQLHERRTCRADETDRLSGCGTARCGRQSVGRRVRLS